MRYAEARSLVCTGDLIAIRTRRKLFDLLTSAVTQSPYTHTAVAVWGGFNGVERLLVVESNAAGASLSPLSKYDADDFDVFECPVIAAASERAVWELLGEKIHYDVADLARIAANRLLGMPLPRRDDGRKVCSAHSAAIYLRAGWQPEALPSIPAPDDVVAAIGAYPKLYVRKD